MTESAYQSKIIKAIIADGGHAITGMFKTGEADIQAGYYYKGVLRTICIEVKTPKDYDRVMKCVSIVDDLYVRDMDCKGLKKHEPLQIHKLNEVRKRGGLALFAHSYEQVLNEIIKRHNNDSNN